MIFLHSRSVVYQFLRKYLQRCTSAWTHMLVPHNTISCSEIVVQGWYFWWSSLFLSIFLLWENVGIFWSVDSSLGTGLSCLKDRSKHKHHSSLLKKKTEGEKLFGFSTSRKFNFAVHVGERIFRTKVDVFAEDSHTTSYVCVLVLGSRWGGMRSNKAGFVTIWLVFLFFYLLFYFFFKWAYGSYLQRR